MDLKKLLLLKLLCCGGPLLVLMILSVAFSTALAALVDVAWYLVVASGIGLAFLLWWSRRRRIVPGCSTCDGQGTGVHQREAHSRLEAPGPS